MHGLRIEVDHLVLNVRKVSSLIKHPRRPARESKSGVTIDQKTGGLVRRLPWVHTVYRRPFGQFAFRVELFIYVNTRQLHCRHLVRGSSYQRAS